MPPASQPPIAVRRPKAAVALIMLAAYLTMACLAPIRTVSEIATPGQAFTDCDQLLDYYRAVTWDAVQEDPYRFRSAAWDTTVESAARGRGGSAGVTSATGTNLSVADVDEADFVKTDGSHFFLVAYERFAIFTLRDHQPPERTTLIKLSTANESLAYSELLIASDRALWFRSIRGGFVDEDGDKVDWTTEINELDLSNPAAPRVLRTLTLLHMGYLGAHLVNGQVRVVLSDVKEPALAYPRTHGASASEIEENVEDTEKENNRIIRRAGLNAWHPTYELLDHRTDERSTGFVVPCSRTYLPTTSDRGQSGIYMITFDTSTGLEHWDAVSLLDDVSAVYATTESVYVVSRTARRSDSQIHHFTVDDRAGLTYSGSVAVLGEIDGAKSLDEYDKHLWVWYTQRDGRETKSRMLIIAPDAWSASFNSPGSGGEGAAKPERHVLAADVVMFAGALVYASDINSDGVHVTVLDRREPNKFANVGELDLPSSTWYIHPLEENKALIVGRECEWIDTCSDIMISQIGTIEPSSVAVGGSVSVSGTSLRVLDDDRAFLFSNDVAWVLAYNGNKYSAYGIKVAGESVTIDATLPVGQFTSRAIVVGRTLYLIAQTGKIYTHDLDNYTNLGEVTLGDQEQ